MSLLADALSGLPNLSEPVPGLLAGGQPTAAHLRAFKDGGGVAVIDMRDPMEPRPYRTPDAVVAAGLEYHNVAVPHDPGSDDILESVRTLVTMLAAKGPVLAHCASGNRTGAALIPYLILDQGMSEDDAVTEAMRMGTRSSELIQWALVYARAHQS